MKKFMRNRKFKRKLFDINLDEAFGESSNVVMKEIPPPLNMNKVEQIDYVRIQQAYNEASLSSCVKWNVGCIITDRNGRIVSTGYNGTPTGHENCSSHFSEYSTDQSHEHHLWSNKNEVHAEMNALMYSDRSDREGGTLYVTLQPCATCAKMICASGISRVVFSEKYHRTDDYELAKELYMKSGIELVWLGDEHK